MASTLEFVPSRIPKASKHQPQLLGYILKSDWILDFGQKHNVDPQGLKSDFALIVDSVELVRDELKEEGEYALIRYLSSGTVEEVAQIYVARNFLSVMKGSETPARIRGKVERLKKFLGTTDEPRWMSARRSQNLLPAMYPIIA